MIDEALELLTILTDDQAGLDYFSVLKKTFCRYCGAESFGAPSKHFRHDEECPVAQARALLKARAVVMQELETQSKAI